MEKNNVIVCKKCVFKYCINFNNKPLHGYKNRFTWKIHYILPACHMTCIN